MVITPIKHLIANQGLQLNKMIRWIPLNNMDSAKPTTTPTNITFQDTHISMNNCHPLQKEYGIATTTTYHTTLTSTPAFINLLILMLTIIITTQYMFTRHHILVATTTNERNI
ncbi:hypothetical protein BGZ81_009429 [Podila clonocystis]|nr:hypothetical protein BGZ81_009429 [Podila clonocystis]